MCTKTAETYRIDIVLCTHTTHAYIDNPVQYTSTHLKEKKGSIVHKSAYVMQHLHYNVINANMGNMFLKRFDFI